MLYFAIRAFGFLITNINIKITIYCSPSLLSFSILSLLFHILSSISLPSSLHISPRSLLFLSLISPHVFDLLIVLASPPAPSLSLLLPSHSCSLSPRPHLCNPLSFSSLTHTLSPPYCTSILLFSLSSLTYLSLCPSTFFLLYFDSLILYYLSASLSLYLFIHLLLVHFLAGSSSYSLLLLANFLQFFLFLIPSKPVPVYLYFTVSYFHLFSSISLLSGQLSSLLLGCPFFFCQIVIYTG
jgi:hypothetical protein